MSIKEKYTVERISNLETNKWLLDCHYSHRLCSRSYSFGLKLNNLIVGVCTFGSPASRPLCNGICGKEYSNIVIELNRLIKLDNLEKNVTSYFVSQCIKQLPQPLIIVSYADSSQNHNGYIYQALNFIYTGLSAKRTEWRMKDSNLHSKSICDRFTLQERKNNDNFFLADRPQKHRYVYFHGDKRMKRDLLKKLNYPILDYPKTVNINYKINSDFYNNLKEKIHNV